MASTCSAGDFFPEALGVASGIFERNIKTNVIVHHTKYRSCHISSDKLITTEQHIIILTATVCFNGEH